MAVAGGLGLGLGHSPYDQPWLAFVALPLLFLLWAETGTARRAAWLGWQAGLGYFGLTLFWIVDPFLVDIGTYGWMAPFAVFFMAAGMALFWALAFGVARGLTASRGFPGLLALAAALAGAGLLRAYVLTGFPWALPAYAWTGTPVAQAAAWLGPHGLGLVLLTLGLLPGLLRPLPVVAALAGLGGLWVAGAARLDTPPPSDTGVTLRLVQPNAAQHLKWKAEMLPVFYTRQVDLTAARPAGGRAPDLVVWPETAVPFLLGDQPDLRADMAAAAGPDAQVVFGVRRVDDQGRWYNSLAAIGVGGALETSYDKSHLVPFGEYMPLSGTIEALGLSWLTEGLVGSFTPGGGAERLSLPGLPPFQPLICYEAIFPQEILTGAARPGWLLQITNDAWFGLWSGPYQHLAQARMRAIEQGLPLARAANTGVSAMIDPYGRVTAMLPLGQSGFIDAALPAALAPTPYARSGDAPALALVLLLLGGVAVAGRRRRA